MKNAIRNISLVSNNQQISQLKQSSLFQNNHQNISYENTKSLRDNNENENENGLLFSNIVFLLYGSFPNSGPTRQQIAELLLSGAATVVTSIKAFYDHKETRFLIPQKTQDKTTNKFKKVRKYE